MLLPCNICFDTGNLSLDASPYIINAELEDHTDEETGNSTVPIHKRELGRRIYNKVRFTWPVSTHKFLFFCFRLLIHPRISGKPHSQTYVCRI